ncbi:MAG: tRNA (adenosine(37)-N6)-dimethylallyltransferase MiaA [Rubrivivax sp.]|nr:tRNA (adenosine(37)-N6)-dimethylallyltransferase MiaA [Rubrivivax sp.]MDP3615601.1 tRNA (adenosine(37)-N6)-dimethylallyltransferase MiaA [Rubrivivax sp.]
MKPLALCLAGPTASGKSAVAMLLAQQLPVEIISVDSALVYRGMDIGTAKPSAAERAAVPHHLIDILAPTETYSAAQFVADTLALVPQIQARGRVPVLVGGTMMYFHALRQGLHTMPPADAQVRADIDARAAQLGWPALHAELARIDPATARRLAPADGQRIQRALEVWQISGRTLSQWHGDDKHAAPPAANWPLVSLEPESRAWLHRRIEQRFDAMLAAGLLDEVRVLQQLPGLHADLPSMRCVGYRQAWQALQNPTPGCTVDDTQRSFRATALAATRQLAKRQLTWLRSISSRQVIACDQAGAQVEALRTLKALASSAHLP